MCIRDSDNAPLFSQSSYSYDFTDANIRRYRQEIVTVSATDSDNGENGTVGYSISQVTKNDQQAIITITASDMGNPTQSSNTTLTVNFESSCLLQEYKINAESGQVMAYVFCRIEIQPSSLNVSLGSSGSSFGCSILHNSRLSYQWIHNSSLITLPTLIPERTSAADNYTITNARFEDTGEYACKATTRAGSLQTSSSSVKIQGT